MGHLKLLTKIDFRLLFFVLALMTISLFVISSTTCESLEGDCETFFTLHVKKQLQFFLMGSLAFIFFTLMDYRKLREWTWVLYLVVLFLLLGLFFTPTIQHVHRWYRIGGFALQPSEYAKFTVILALSWFLEHKAKAASAAKTAFQACCIILIPFLLILKQPDLGTALVLLPIGFFLFYFGGGSRKIVIALSSLAILGILLASLLFLGVVDREQLRPYMTKVLKEYQYERLSQESYHQMAAQTAISLGGITGSGWHKSNFTGRKWLPESHTDSIFPAFAEEFGFIGVLVLLCIFFGLVYTSFQVAILAQDLFGRLLAIGITAYLIMHILINLGMMCGFLPITGVPLILVSYGGSSILATMGALGVLQSIYIRRFTF